MERYTERQNQKLLASSNAFQNVNSSSTWNLSKNQRDPSDIFSSINSGLENPVFSANPLLNSGPDNRTLAGQNQDDDRSKLFDSPKPVPSPNTARQMDLERFRQLLGTSPSPAPATTPSSNDKLFSRAGMPDVKSGPSSLNPMGVLFSPQNNGIGKPAGLPALPGALSLSYTSSSPAAAWAPQRPPWMTPDSQPFAVPQRRF